jgi:hypothetical protein
MSIHFTRVVFLVVTAAHTRPLSLRPGRNTTPWFDNETCHSSKRKETLKRHEEKQKELRNLAIGKTFETYVTLLKHWWHGSGNSFSKNCQI